MNWNYTDFLIWDFELYTSMVIQQYTVLIGEKLQIKNKTPISQMAQIVAYLNYTDNFSQSEKCGITIVTSVLPLPL